jgi:hypothetical protein
VHLYYQYTGEVFLMFKCVVTYLLHIRCILYHNVLKWQLLSPMAYIFILSWQREWPDKVSTLAQMKIASKSSSHNTPVEIIARVHEVCCINNNVHSNQCCRQTYRKTFCKWPGSSNGTRHKALFLFSLFSFL